MIGGYRIADFAGNPATSGTAQTIPGMFEVVKNPYRKPLLIEGLTVGDLVLPGFFATFTKDGNNYVGTSVIGSNSVLISVTPADSVTVTVTPASRSTETKTAVKAVKK